MLNEQLDLIAPAKDAFMECMLHHYWRDIKYLISYRGKAYEGAWRLFQTHAKPKGKLLIRWWRKYCRVVIMMKNALEKAMVSLNWSGVLERGPIRCWRRKVAERRLYTASLWRWIQIIECQCGWWAVMRWKTISENNQNYRKFLVKQKKRRVKEKFYHLKEFKITQKRKNRKKERLIAVMKWFRWVRCFRKWRHWSQTDAISTPILLRAIHTIRNSERMWIYLRCRGYLKSKPPQPEPDLLCLTALNA